MDGFDLVFHLELDLNLDLDLDFFLWQVMSPRLGQVNCTRRFKRWLRSQKQHTTELRQNNLQEVLVHEIISSQ